MKLAKFSTQLAKQFLHDNKEKEVPIQRSIDWVRHRALGMHTKSLAWRMGDWRKGLESVVSLQSQPR